MLRLNAMAYRNISLPKGNSNTSHVTVKPGGIVLKEDIYTNSNTSHVTVKPNTPVKINADCAQFKYIPCYG